MSQNDDQSRPQDNNQQELDKLKNHMEELKNNLEKGQGFSSEENYKIAPPFDIGCD